MIAKVEVSFNSNASRVLGTIIEGIDFDQGDYNKPNASTSRWILKTSINVSPDNIVNVTGLIVGRPSQKSQAKIKIKYRKDNDEKTKEKAIDPDKFSTRNGVLLFNEAISIA